MLHCTLMVEDKDNATVTNANQMPQVWYGRHMSPGVAEYREGDKVTRILLNESTIRAMDATFPGKPVYVGHVDSVNPATVERADGYVVESFFNEADSCHWVKFLAVTDKAHAAIRQGYRLSNAYKVKDYRPGGMSKGVDYTNEVTKGEYEHLALVTDPRYEDSIVLSPSQFKEYNQSRELELRSIANTADVTPALTEKGMLHTMFTFFKKTKVENSAEFLETVVKLPVSGKEMTIAECISAADVKAEPTAPEIKNEIPAPAPEVKLEAPKAEDSKAPEAPKAVENASDAPVETPAPVDAKASGMITLGGKQISVTKLEKLLNAILANADDSDEDEDDEKKKEKKENSVEPKVLNKAAADDFFTQLQTAPLKGMPVPDTSILNGVALGRQRYGKK